MTLVADTFSLPPAIAPSRFALPLSVLAHALLLMAALWLIRPTAVDDPAELESVAVEIVTMQTASDSKVTAQSDAMTNMVAAGSVAETEAVPVTEVAETAPLQWKVEAATPVAPSPTRQVVEPDRPAVAVDVPDALTPEKTEAVAASAEPVAVTPVLSVIAAEDAPVAIVGAEAGSIVVTAAPLASIEPVETPDVPGVRQVHADETATPVEQPAPRAVQPTMVEMQPVDAAPSTVKTQPVEPAASIEPMPPIDTKPLKQVRVVQQTADVQPDQTVEQVKPVEQVQPVDDPAPKTPSLAKKQPDAKPVKRPPARVAANSGSGGKSEANAQASAAPKGGAGKQALGGSGAQSRYPGQVQAKLKRALRAPPGNRRGQAYVSFVVHADGSVSNIQIAQSTGSSTLDDAAAATVRRAAPFPPIPADANRSSWSFTLPLQFR